MNYKLQALKELADAAEIELKGDCPLAEDEAIVWAYEAMLASEAMLARESKTSLTQEDIYAIKYFHENGEDISKWDNWVTRKQLIRQELPLLIKAMQDVEDARAVLDVIVKNLEGL